MKRKILWVIMMAVVTLLVGGCGNSTEDINKKDAIIASSTNEEGETENIEETDTKAVEFGSDVPAMDDIDSKITEKDDSELNLKSYYYSMEDRTVCDGGEDVFGFVLFENTDSLNYVTIGEVPIYAQNGVKLGYTKESVDIIVLGVYGDWCYFDLNGENKYARLSDIEANAITIAERDAKAEEEANKQEEATVKTETPVENVPAEQPVIDEPSVPDESVETPASDKYTPEEAIAVYCSLMESGGITWNPALKDGGSWGTGFMYLDKGYAEWAASSSLESFAMGDSVGNPWTEYYLEVTGSDEEAVYYTMWAE